MNKHLYLILSVVVCASTLSSCVSKKRKKGQEVSKTSKFYHNLNSKYNGIFNAGEIMDETYMMLEASYQDDYSKILPVFPYIANENAKAASADMDIVVEKATRVALIHEVGEYVDDCYVLMGEAQFVKKDYETAEETLEYFREEFNPINPYGRGYTKKKKSRKQIKKEREKVKKEREKEREEEKKAREEAKKKAEAEKKEAKKARDKARKEAEKRKKQEREAAKKEREKSRKGKKRGKPGSKKRPAKVTTPTTIAKADSTATTVAPNPVVKPKDSPKEQEEEDIEEPKKKKEEPLDETAYSEGLLWLAKVYIERDNYSSADNILRKLAKKNVMKHVREDIAPTHAHLYLRKGEPLEAIPHLEEAIETSRSKTNKARYAYIIGQIYQQNGFTDAALAAFAQVNKFKPSFDMRFNAQLAAMRNAVKTGTRTQESVGKELDRMIAEAKYRDYLDQLYFTVASIDLSLGNYDKAVEGFTKSIANNSTNTTLKTEAYHTVANLYYDQESYLQAKYYYDSTLQVMSPEDLRYTKTKVLSDNLSDIARNIETIQLQDSLLMIAAMSPEEQKDLARELATKIAEDAMSEDQEQNESSKETKNSGQLDQIFGVSDVWPYDLRKVEQGKQAFADKWGDIPLQDNWRRSSEINSVLTGQEEEEAIDEQSVKVADKDIQAILKDIPSSPTEIADANTAIQRAMYDLGVLYRGKVGNFEKSISTLQNLVDRYPDTQHKLDAYYNIYLAYLDLNDSEGAERYLALITSEYPETTIAKTLKNPNFGKDKMSEEDRLYAFYEDTYSLFKQAQYVEVTQRVAAASTAFESDYGLKPKFDLLNAMSVGKLSGKEAYKASLTDMITRHKGTPEATRAKEILRFLKGDGDAFDQLDIKEVDDIFKVEDDRRHYVLLVTYDADNAAFTEAKIAVSQYNKKYHKTAKLQLNESYLDKDKGVRVLLIRQFDGKESVMKYYNEISKPEAKRELVGGADLNFELWPATQGNYRRIIQERSTAKYRFFFENHYVGN